MKHFQGFQWLVISNKAYALRGDVLHVLRELNAIRDFLENHFLNLMDGGISIGNVDEILPGDYMPFVSATVDTYATLLVPLLGDSLDVTGDDSLRSTTFFFSNTSERIR